MEESWRSKLYGRVVVCRMSSVMTGGSAFPGLSSVHERETLLVSSSSISSWLHSAEPATVGILDWEQEGHVEKSYLLLPLVHKAESCKVERL